MALLIIYESGTVLNLHLPFESNVAMYGTMLTASMVKQVQADGDELDYINLHFGGNQYTPSVPFVRTHRKIMRWYGDNAKFIIGNLVP